MSCFVLATGNEQSFVDLFPAVEAVACCRRLEEVYRIESLALLAKRYS